MNSWRQVAADRPAFRDHRDRAQAHAREGAQVSDEHAVIGVLGAGEIEVEGIGVLHQELAPAHHPEARPHLVAEFPLDVIEIERQILVGAHVAAEDLRDHFLVGRPVEHVALVAILDAQHFLAIGLVAAALAPQIGGLDGRHQKLDRAGAVLLLAHDGADLLQHPKARAAGRHKCRPLPGGSCRRAASAGARRSPPLSAFHANWAGSIGKGAWNLIGRISRAAVKPQQRRKYKGREKASGEPRPFRRHAGGIFCAGEAVT